LVGGFTSANINTNTNNTGSIGYDYGNNQYSSISNSYGNNNSTNVYDQGRATLGSGYVIPKIKYRHIEDQKNKINNINTNNNSSNTNINNNSNINRQ
jgi:hypothetical protein